MSTPAYAVAALPIIRHRWSDDDIALMLAHWATLGTVKIQPMLSVWRSESCIQNKAKHLGLARKGRGPYLRYPQNDLVDHQIRQAYATGKKGEIQALSARLGRAYGWIRWRAMQIGCRPVRLKEPDWSAAEDAIFERMDGKGVTAIQTALRRAGFVRTVKAVYCRIHTLGLDLHGAVFMTLEGAARGLGVDSGVLERWVRAHGLKLTPRTNHDGEISAYRWVSRAELRRFIVANVVLVDIRKADKFWLVDLLAVTR